jgi:hypothetical protein
MAREVLNRVCFGTSKVHEHPTLAARAAKLLIKPAVLHDYCRHRVQWADYPGMIYEKDHSVRGTYVTGLTDGDISRLDQFEGSEYAREKVKVMIVEDNDTAQGDVVDTETYVFTGGDWRLEKREWDFEEFRQEKLQNWADHSVEYQGMFLANDKFGSLLTYRRGRRGRRLRPHWRTRHPCCPNQQDPTEGRRAGGRRRGGHPQECCLEYLY